MARLTPQPRKKIIQALTKAHGWTFDREGRRHTIYKKDGIPESIAVPRHKKISPGVIKNICKILEVTISEFMDTLGQC